MRKLRAEPVEFNISTAIQSGAQVTFDINNVKNPISLLDNETFRIQRKKNSKKRRAIHKLTPRFASQCILVVHVSLWTGDQYKFTGAQRPSLTSQIHY